MEKLISVILPIYNTEKYLDKCILSILNQTYKNIEVICIDDGSNDNSGKILDKYAKVDNRIIAIHQENKGESATRNVGLKIAKGDIWTFCDCDDWLEPDMYERLLEKMESTEADIALGSWFEEFPKESIPVENKFELSKNPFDKNDFFYHLYRRDDYRAFGYMWDKLYKKECFFDAKENLILFDENLILGGDIIYLARLVANCKKAVFVDTPFYHYRQRPDSGTFSRNLKNRLGAIKAYEMVIDLLKENRIRKDAIGYAKRFLGYHCVLIARDAIKSGDKDILEILRGYMKKYEDSYCEYNKCYPDRIEEYESFILEK